MSIISSNLQAGIYKVLGNPLMIILIGLVEGAAYLFSFKYLIKKMNLGTPGCEEEVIGLQKTVKHNAKKKTSQEQLSTNNNIPRSGQTDSKFVTSQNSVNQRIDIQKDPNGPLKLS